MQKKGQKRGFIEYREPIPLHQQSQYSSVELITHVYQSAGNNRGKVTFKLSKTSVQVFTLKSFISLVELTYNSDNDVYELPVQDFNAIKAIKSRRPSHRSSTSRRHEVAEA